MIFLYVLLGVSILMPVYTYAIYPYILKFFPSKNFRMDGDFYPRVSVLIVDTGSSTVETKKRNIELSDYTNIIEILTVDCYDSARNNLISLKGDVIVMTNTSSLYSKETISKLIAPLCNYSVGCVCGMSRKQPDKGGMFSDGANWIYENKIKIMESNIGSLSGANATIYAFKKKCLPKVMSSYINLDFFIPTIITQAGLDVVFQKDALAYEIDSPSHDILFNKHVLDGSSAYRSITYFWRLLLPRKGSFVFWSHRVMKWLVPFNLLFILAVSLYLALESQWFLIFSAFQICGYMYIALYYIFYSRKKKQISGVMGKLSEFACYFMALNIAWLLGLFRNIRK